MLQQQEAIAACFNTCSSCEEQQLSICNSCLSGLSFNTCSSCEEQLIRVRRSTGNRRFNTCSSCEEQRGRFTTLERRCLFQYMLLLRGATRKRRKTMSITTFQYMLLLRGATFRGLREPRFGQVSIHAPLARSNISGNFSTSWAAVSIHAPLARSNVKTFPAMNAPSFQYMLLLRGATRYHSVLQEA